MSSSMASSLPIGGQIPDAGGVVVGGVTARRTGEGTGLGEAHHLQVIASASGGREQPKGQENSDSQSFHGAPLSKCTPTMRLVIMESGKQAKISPPRPRWPCSNSSWWSQREASPSLIGRP